MRENKESKKEEKHETPIISNRSETQIINTEDNVGIRTNF